MGNGAVTKELSPGDRRFGTILLYLAIVFIYVRPQEIIPGLKGLPIAGVFIYACAAWSFLHFNRQNFNSPLRLMLLIIAVIGISSIGARNFGALKTFIDYLTQLLPLVYAVYLLVDTHERVERFFMLWIFVHTAAAVYTITNGGRGPGSFIGNQNDVAVAMVMVLPFIAYVAWSDGKSKRLRLLLYFCALLVIGAMIATRSRGGFVAFSAVVIGMWWLSDRRWRNLLMGLVAAVLLGGALVSLVPSEYVDEVSSISDKENSTRIERIRTWEIAWLMYKANPVLGVGAKNFRFNVNQFQEKTSWWTGREKSLQGRAAHSVYFDLIAELGTVGALIYGYIMFRLPWRLYRIRNQITRTTPEDRLLARNCAILILSMAAFLAGGAFVSIAYYPHIPFWIAMYAVLIRQLDGSGFLSTSRS